MNEGLVGEKVILACDKFDGPHGMCMVGYDDTVWADVNGNDQIDTGEMGAFKIVNSWGEGYGNGGFMWLAYDALNYHSVVPLAYNACERVPILIDACRIDVVKNASPHLFAEYTISTAHRSDFRMELTVSWANTSVSENLNPAQSSTPEHIMNFSGTTGKASGTFLYDVENLLNKLGCPDIREADLSLELIDFNAENEYTSELLSFRIYDENDPTLLLTPQVSLPQTFVSLDTMQPIEISKGVHHNAVIYYRGYDTPKIRYQVGSGSFTAEEGLEMWYTLEELGYVYKYVIPLQTASSAKVMFLSPDGQQDTNGGKYYTAVEGVNTFSTPGAGKPFAFSVKNRASEQVKVVDVGFRDDPYGDPMGGFEPFRYRMKLENIDTGEVILDEPFGDYNHGFYAGRIRSGGYSYTEPGHFKATVYGEDSTGAQAETYYLVTVEDLPLRYEYMECQRTYAQLCAGDYLTFVAQDANDKMFPGQYYHQFTVLHQDRVVFSKKYAPLRYSMDEKTAAVTASFTPMYSGHYTAVFSRVDVNKEYACITYEFDVEDHGFSVDSFTVTPEKDLSLGDSVALSVTTSDTSGEVLYSYAYRRYNQEFMVEEDTEDSRFAMKLPDEPGPYTLIAMAKNSSGLMAYQEKAIWVNPPRLTGLTIPDGPLYANTDYTVGLIGDHISTGLSADAVHYILSNGTESTPLTTDANKKTTLRAAKTGTYRLTAQVEASGMIVASVSQDVTIEANPVPDSHLIYVAVISYIENEGGQANYALHYWNSSTNGDVALESTGKTVTKSVGSGYWGGAAQTFTLYTARIPAEATGFKFHIGTRWFGSDGVVGQSNCAYIFNYSGDKCLYDTLTL